jgi:hypothetical protein
MSEPLDPKEAATLFYAGHILAPVADTGSPFVCGQWMGKRSFVTRIPFDEAGAEAYFTENPAVLYSEAATAAPVVVDAPYVGGDAVAGGVLTCTKGNWSGDPTSYVYQWQRDGAVIAGEDDTSYTVTDVDVDHTIDCAVTATNAIGSTVALSNGVRPAA